LLVNKSEQLLLFKHVRRVLGYPIRQINITDEILEQLLIITIEDYIRYIKEWSDTNNVDIKLLELPLEINGKNFIVTKLFVAEVKKNLSYVLSSFPMLNIATDDGGIIDCESLMVDAIQSKKFLYESLDIILKGFGLLK
jgi:hypothetical protein